MKKKGIRGSSNVVVGALFEARFQGVAIEFELVELLLQLAHGVHESRSF